MTTKVLNIKSTGVFSVIIEGSWELGPLDVTDSMVPIVYQEKLQAMIDDLQSGGFQEIHLEENLTNSFVHKVGNGNFEETNDPNSYELFATMKEWTSAFEDIENTP